MLSLAEPPKSCRHHNTLSSNHLGVEGLLRLGLWVRGLENPIVLVYQLFCHPQTFIVKVGVREIIITYVRFPEAATSTNMWSRGDQRKSISA